MAHFYWAAKLHYKATYRYPESARLMEVQLPAKSSWNDRLFVWERAVLCELFTLKIKCVATLQWSVYWTSVDHMLLILCEITINEAKNDQRVPRMICGKSKFFSARFYFSFLAYHSHKTPRWKSCGGRTPRYKVYPNELSSLKRVDK